MSNYIDIEQIYQLTDGGKDIITSYFPKANERKAFKIRDEKTASTSLKKFNNIWFVTDFGSEAKGKNAIDIVQQEEGLNFHDALKYINDRFCGGKLNGSASSSFNKPIVEDAKNNTGKTILEFNKTVSAKELSFIGKDVNFEIAERYNLKSLKFYITKSGKKITATPEYPILCFDQGDWQKIYQPKADKAYRFFHVGTRPKDFLFGLEQLKADVEELKKQAKIRLIKENEGEEIKEEELDERIRSEIEKDFSDVIIASGERDAFNIAAAGHTVIWQNSETAILKIDEYNLIRGLSKQIYNVPDLDETGVRQAYALALKYTEIKTIWLPEKLRNFKDWRNNPCKDATDFFEKFSRPKELFGKMKSVAFSLKFWYYDKKYGYILNNLSFYEFLHANGYYRIEDKNNKYGYVYIKLKDKVVEKIQPEGGKIKNHVRNFVNNYLERKFQAAGLRNMFFKTRQTDENSLSNLKNYNSLDFETYGKKFQYLFFKNKAWKITAAEISEEPIKSVDKHVWEYDIKDKIQAVRLDKKPMFEITFSDTYKEFLKTATDKENFPDIDKYDIKINDDSFIFLKYLINASRMYWKKQRAGAELSETEKKEQRLHLINKIYSVGYLVHRYKNPSRPWAVFAVDGRESEMGKSYGGSGKSILYGSIEHVNNQFYIGGRDPRKLKNDFLFDGIDEFTDNVLVDDANQYLDFGMFYPSITGKMNINPKNSKPFTLNFNDSPKFAFTSNFAIRNIDPSTERRILYTVFSDYYHKKDQDGYYKDSLDPEKEFGKILFDDFTENEWNSFYNFIALAVQTYLKFEKIQPPMESVVKRNLRSSIGEDVLTWANDFFTNTENLNAEISKEDAFRNCTEKYIPRSKQNYFSIRKFKTAVKQYCQYRNWNFNPAGACNDNQDRIMKNIEGKVFEYFYIQTDDDEPINIINETIEDIKLTPKEHSDEIPF